MNPWKEKRIIGNAELYLGDCLEILPTLGKVDAVITDDIMGHEKSASRERSKKRNRGGALGIEANGDCAPLPSGRTISGRAGEPLRDSTSRDVQGSEAARHQGEAEVAEGCGERALRPRFGEHALQEEGQEEGMRRVRGEGSLVRASQERGPSGQPEVESAGAVLAVPQQTTQSRVVGKPPRIALITDPPYGIAFSHGAGGDGIGGGKYVSRFNGVPIIGDDRPFDPTPFLQLGYPSILWGANHYADRLPSSPYWLIWDKRCGLTENDFADCEMAWCNVKGVARVFRHYWNGMMRDSERGAPRVHPTQKPIEVMQWCVERLGYPSTVLDPFMGSGTTGVACMNLGRKFIGIEIEKKYFDIACERIDQAQRQLRMFA